MATSYVKDLKWEQKYTIELRARIGTLEAELPDAPKQAAEVKDSPETTEKLAQAEPIMQGRKRAIEDLKLKVSNLEARVRELSSMAEGEKVDAANQIIAHAAPMDRALLMCKCDAREQSIKKDWQSFMPGHLKDRERHALKNGKTCKELASEVEALTKELSGQKEERKGLEKRMRELTKGTKWETENKIVPSGTHMKRSSELAAKRQKVEA